MKKLLFISIVISGILFQIAGCVGPEKTPKPDNLIDENNYVDLLVELQHLRTYNNAYPDSVNVDSVKSLIFERFSVSEEQFLSTHSFYQKQTKDQIVRVNEVINRLNEEEQYIRTHIDSVKTARQPQTVDSVSID